MDEKSYRALLDGQDWAEIYKRLFDFALSRCGKKARAQAADLAQTAITRVFAFDSKWDPAKEPDLVRYLMSVVNSQLSNERTSHATRKNVSSDTRKGKRAAESVADSQAYSEGVAVENDLLARRLKLLKERMADDANVLALLDCIENRLDAPGEICAKTGWSPQTLLAVRRRMSRAAMLVARDIGGGEDDARDDGRERDEDDDDAPLAQYEHGRDDEDDEVAE